ncbi:MAG: xylose isomerase, partial [Akkermansiaceae bacterium]|nr:xylose isomerase [Akkermansiaceae bacterium]
MMDRRTFSRMAGGAALLAGVAQAQGEQGAPYKMGFAPHPNMLPTGPKDYIDQLKFAWDHGFRAWEDNGLTGRDAQLQEQVGEFVK